MAKRIRRPSKFDDMLTDMTSKKVFETYKDVLIFAACLGFKRKKRVPFTKSGEPIDLQIFSGEFNTSVINIIAVAESSDLSYMGQDKEAERIVAFEEYACGGLEIIKNEYWDTKLDLNKGLAALIMQEQETDEQCISDITALSI